MNKEELYDLISDIAWARFMWQLAIIGGLIVAIGIGIAGVVLF